MNSDSSPERVNVRSKVFDFSKVRVVIKRPGKDDEVKMLDKMWTRDNIPHFRKVIDEVKTEEGIEITLTCNLDAFDFAVDYLRVQTEQQRHEMVFDRVTLENCLNHLVTADFLKLREVYDTIWQLFFKPNFLDVINGCNLNLSGLNQNIFADIAERIPLA